MYPQRIRATFPSWGGARNYDPSLRPSDLPSIRISCPPPPTEVLIAISSPTGNFSAADSRARRIPSEECDRPLALAFPRCALTRDQLVHAIRTGTPGRPPPQMWSGPLVRHHPVPEYSTAPQFDSAPPSGPAHGYFSCTAPIRIIVRISTLALLRYRTCQKITLLFSRNAMISFGVGRSNSAIPIGF